MTRLDRAIADVHYILDTLLAYRNIVQTGDCNRCKIKKECGACPRPGEQVRYNCMFYVPEKGDQP